jgi:hypothetical protein
LCSLGLCITLRQSLYFEHACSKQRPPPPPLHQMAKRCDSNSIKNLRHRLRKNEMRCVVQKQTAPGGLKFAFFLDREWCAKNVTAAPSKICAIGGANFCGRWLT